MKRIMSVLFASVLVLAACGSDDSSSSEGEASSDAEFNDADVSFAQGMIPHHEQAVEMSDLALTNSESDEVQELAEEIQAAQGPEIETMEGFLADWGQEAPSGGMDEMDGMDPGDDGMEEMEGMQGMMSADEMADLSAATGAEFDTMFLEMMIEHHEGAITMGEVQLADGANDDAKELAEEIIEAQQAEIDQMESLLQNA
ncbi:DUF305 domain-containing protein [soil metagenome]